MPNWYLTKEKNIFKLVKIFDQISPLLDDIETNRRELAVLIRKIDDYDVVLAHPRYDGHKQHLENFIQAVVSKESVEKSKLHFERLRKVVRVVANDTPFSRGDRVYIERIRGGWGLGFTGKVTKAILGKNDLWRYLVMLDEEHGGYETEVEHTRDMSRINW